MQQYSNQTFSDNSIVGWSGTSGGNIYVGDYFIEQPWYYNFYEHYYPLWFPTTTIVTEKSKVEQAFKIVGKLLEKKIIEKLTVKRFIELVNDIAGIL